MCYLYDKPIFRRDFYENQLNELMNELTEWDVGIIKMNELLANHTTIKIGGPADLFVEPSSIANLEKTMELIRKYKVKWRAIGRGSNLLVSDKGIEGVVIKLGNGLNHMELDGTIINGGGGFFPCRFGCSNESKRVIRT